MFDYCVLRFDIIKYDWTKYERIIKKNLTINEDPVEHIRTSKKIERRFDVFESSAIRVHRRLENIIMKTTKCRGLKPLIVDYQT